MLKIQSISFIIFTFLFFSCKPESEFIGESKKAEVYKVKLFRNFELSPSTSNLNTYSNLNLKITESFIDKNIKIYDYQHSHFVYDNNKNTLKGNWLGDDMKELNFIDKKSFTINHQKISVSKFVKLKLKNCSCCPDNNYDTIRTLYFSNEIGIIHNLGSRYFMNFELIENSKLEGINDVEKLFESLNKEEEFYPNVHETALRKSFFKVVEIIVPEEEELDEIELELPEY
ncbi:hypothetical protein [Flammeovirga kamogawensis]|uniref:Uncharacterized protein n=1 Tax=Flammeovirga kamogawensis TaxID=373891 RepID=A0ABX8GRN4_9BACT|nr:hypothetical protein [Flammeovirga kamogawensis]MBB6463696.1 hypothetical protein [Flammeovirga kamogawensis]QWG06196.1 hypothetical protein KM029_12685 [Flammeovirga kamogawensis]TRX68027.1 hypothetical protein EO216_07705 [Flammeovirga kamogawensis]